MKPTKEEVVDCMFTIIHLELALQKMELIAEKNHFWNKQVKQKGNIFLKELQTKMDIFIGNDGGLLDQFLELKNKVRELNFQAIELLNKQYEQDQQQVDKQPLQHASEC